MVTLKDRSPPTRRLCETAQIGQIIQFIINKNLKTKIMKTAQLNGSAVNGKTNTQLNGKSEVKTLAPIGNSSVTNKVESKPDEPKKVEISPVTKTIDQQKPQTDAPKAEEVKAEPTKAEIKEQMKEEKPALNLERTIKLALDLNRRINQRGKLLETINTLESFEVAQQDDAEETDTSFYQGCTLTIEDDKGREFTTKNPFIIKEVANKVNRLCVDKLAEIEGEIFIPA